MIATDGAAASAWNMTALRFDRTRQHWRRQSFSSRRLQSGAVLQRLRRVAPTTSGTSTFHRRWAGGTKNQWADFLRRCTIRSQGGSFAVSGARRSEQRRGHQAQNVNIVIFRKFYSKMLKIQDRSVGTGGERLCKIGSSLFSSMDPPVALFRNLGSDTNQSVTRLRYAKISVAALCRLGEIFLNSDDSYSVHCG